MKKKITTFNLRKLPVGTACHRRNGAKAKIDKIDLEDQIQPARVGGIWHRWDGSYLVNGGEHPWDILAVEVEDDTPAQPMSHNDQTNAFADDLDKLVERYRQEFEITYAQVVGCLQLKIHTLCAEAASRRDEVK